MLLTPGNTTPIAIKNPDITRNKNEKLLILLDKCSLSSKNTKKHPNINDITVNRTYLNLKVCSEFTFLTNRGILPNISPIKQKLVWAGKVEKSVFNILPNKNTPIIPPKPIGSKYKKFFLKFLNKLNIASISLSYIPKITQITPLLTPGNIAPAPSNIPIKKSNILLKTIHSLVNLDRPQLFILLSLNYYSRKGKNSTA